MDKLIKLCKEKSITLFFPIAVILTIVPLIVRLKKLTVDEETLAVFGAKANSDLFSQNKFTALIFFTCILIIISVVFFKKIFEKQDKLTNAILLLSLIFLSLSFISSLFSSYKKIAFWGIYDRAEGFVTIACYIIIFIYSVYSFKETKNYRHLYIPIAIVVLINGFLGLFQFFGHDLLKTNLGYIFSNVQPNSLNFLYDSGNLYGTLYHYNYVGSLAAIALPLLIGSLFFEDDILMKLFLMLSVLSGIWILFGSTSRAGLVGVSISIILSVIIFRKAVFKSWKPIIISVTGIIVIILGLNIVSDGKMLKKIPTLFSEAASVFSSSNDFDYRDYTYIRDIQHNNGNVILSLQSDELKISYENNTYVFKDSDNNIVNFISKTDNKTKVKTFSTDDTRYSKITFRYGPYLTKSRDDGLLLNIDNKAAFMFNLKSDNSIHMINGNSNQDIELENPNTIGFNGKEKLASSRGYIWSRTLPILKECLLIGKGPDTFVFNFPQNDLIGKLYAYGSATEIVDKPHNLYLQIGINNGLIALAAFLGMIVLYIVDSIKLYISKCKYTSSDMIGIVTFLSICGYLTAGIFNDSVISVAPIFWIVFGVGIAINSNNKKASF